MSTREQVKEIIEQGQFANKHIDDIIAEIDPIIFDFIGEDDHEGLVMPKTWNQALIKQYINFRNHLRRALRAKWGNK